MIKAVYFDVASPATKRTMPRDRAALSLGWDTTNPEALVAVAKG
jgi:hypothetical protein